MLVKYPGILVDYHLCFRVSKKVSEAANKRIVFAKTVLRSFALFALCGAATLLEREDLSEGVPFYDQRAPWVIRMVETFGMSDGLRDSF